MLLTSYRAQALDHVLFYLLFFACFSLMPLHNEREIAMSKSTILGADTDIG